MTKVLSGCGSLNDGQHEELLGEVSSLAIEGIPMRFLRGVITGMSFVSVPEDAETHGMEFKEFVRNAWDDSYIVEDMGIDFAVKLIKEIGGDHGETI